MAVTRADLDNRLNAFRNATPASPISKTAFADFLNDWINYMTNDGEFSAGALRAWRDQILNASAQVSHAPSGQITAITVKAAIEQLDALNLAIKTKLKGSKAIPAVSLDYRNAKTLDRRLGFVRGTTATYIDAKGVMRLARINQPRFDKNGIILEVASTNYFPYRSLSSLAAGYFTKPSVINTTKDIMLENQAVSFVINATNCSGGPSSDTCGYVFDQIPVDPGTRVVASVYMRASKNITTGVYFGTSDAYSGQQLSITTEWKRYEYSGLIDAPSNKRGFQIKVIRNADNLNATIEMCCAQVELGSTASSYIPPVSNQATTRAAEIHTSPYADLLGDRMNSGTIVITGMGNRINSPFWGKYVELKYADDSNRIGVFAHAINDNTIICDAYNNGLSYFSSGTSVVTPAQKFKIALGFKNGKILYSKDGNTNEFPNSETLNAFDTLTIGAFLNATISSVTIYKEYLSVEEATALTQVDMYAGKHEHDQVPRNGDLRTGAYADIADILSQLGKQCFAIDGTGAQVNRNIRMPFDFKFEILDSSGCTVNSQPTATCTANTDNLLAVTAPAGKTLAYAITPIF
ncbi:hypothetical protein GOQ04_17140 [Emticicia sp. ODNR4P]|nr:hypothetical protein [Emticicia sp. ODNR4P]